MIRWAAEAERLIKMIKDKIISIHAADFSSHYFAPNYFDLNIRGFEVAEQQYKDVLCRINRQTRVSVLHMEQALLPVHPAVSSSRLTTLQSGGT